MEPKNTTSTTNALDSLLASPTLAPLVAAVPALAALAADASRERSALTRAAAAALAPAASGEGAITGGAAPIMRHPHSPTVPDADPHFNAPPAMIAMLRAAVEAEIPVLMSGPAGTGKTSAAAAVAAALGRPFAIVHAASVRDSSEWFGSQTLHSGRVAWQDSPLVAALECEGCIVLVDEVNRAATAAQSALLSVCDHQRTVSIPQRAEPITVARGVVLIATANIGYEYSATGALDAAYLDRCIRVETAYLPEQEEARTLSARGATEADARRIAALAASTRDEEWLATHGRPLSTRAAITSARLLASLRRVGEPDAEQIVIRALAAQYEDPATRLALAAAATRAGF